ncbi:MAG TPA: flagellar basal body-associated FliL family protein [Steroidobacteraceae bacterium]|nr:flagellar basal body-associated FliL family protein [Steroidobacteraceae bacterium]
MADIPTLEPAAEVQLADDDETPKKKRSWLLLSAIIASVLLAGGGGAAWYFMGAAKPDGKAKAAAPTGPALYVLLDPPFVTNFEADQAVRFLQITVQVMSHDPATVEIVKANDPVIRNDLLLLFGNQKYTDLASRDGKERLRAQALEAVRRVVATNGGKPERVDAIYFTSFVMQ